MEINRTGDTLQLRGVAHWAAYNADEIKQAVVTACRAGIRHIEIDMSQVEFMDSCGLGGLIAINRLARERHGKLRLINASSTVVWVLQLAHLTPVFEMIGRAARPSPNRPCPIAWLGIQPNRRISTNMKRKHLFEVTAPGADEVLLAGDFTEWQSYAIPMMRRQDGGWQAAVRLDPGTYNYRFIIDGQWLDDPACSAHSPNPFGSQNSVVQVA